MEIKKAEYVKADLLWIKETKYDLKKTRQAIDIPFIYLKVLRLSNLKIINSGLDVPCIIVPTVHIG